MSAQAASRSRAVQTAFKKWINNPGKVLSWMEKYDVERLLDEGGGLTKISNFLPEKVADGALAMLESYKDEVWNETAANRDPTTNNIMHKFWSTKQAPGLPDLFRAISCILPGRLHTFSAGKYVRTNHIEPHDDRQYQNVVMEDGKVVQCSREIAVIWYLTKDWKASDGGALIDCETGKTYVPEYNSVIAFRIPRYHQVTAVEVDRARYSVFGWFLLPGIHYDLDRGGDADQRGQGPAAASLRKASGAAPHSPGDAKRRAADAGGPGSRSFSSKRKGAELAEEGRGGGVRARKRRAAQGTERLGARTGRPIPPRLWGLGLVRVPRPTRFMKLMAPPDSALESR